MWNRARFHTVVIATRFSDCAALTRSMRVILCEQPELNCSLLLEMFVAEAPLRPVRSRPKANNEIVWFVIHSVRGEFAVAFG